MFAKQTNTHFYSFVVIAIDAMDQLLVTCHSLNLFVQSYLKVVQLVLESQDADLQVLATSSVSSSRGGHRVLIVFDL